MVMKLIAHRGNTSGATSRLENSPAYIMSALAKGYDVEIDVWWDEEEGYMLGHDYPAYPITEAFLRTPGFWCHAKNHVGLTRMLKDGTINCFWHQDDDFTLTSHGFIWAFPGINEKLDKNTVAVALDVPHERYNSCIAICTDQCDEFKSYYSNGIKIKK